MNGLRVASSMGSSQRFSPSVPRMPHDLTSAASSCSRTLGRISVHGLLVGLGLRKVGCDAGGQYGQFLLCLGDVAVGLFDLFHVPLFAIDAVGGNDFFLEFGDAFSWECSFLESARYLLLTASGITSFSWGNRRCATGMLVQFARFT